VYNPFTIILFQFIGELIVNNQLRFSCPLALTLSTAIHFFSSLSKVRFASGSEQYVIPTILVAMAKRSELKKLAEEYAEFFQVPLPVILTRCFQVKKEFNLRHTRPLNMYSKDPVIVWDPINSKNLFFVIHGPTILRTSSILFTVISISLRVSYIDDENLFYFLIEYLRSYLAE